MKLLLATVVSFGVLSEGLLDTVAELTQVPHSKLDLTQDDRVSKLMDFCNGTCPSTPGSSGLPRYGQALFPSMAIGPDGNFYIVAAKFGGELLDAPKLVSYTPEGKTRWSLPSKASGGQSSIYLQFVKGMIYMQSVFCCGAQGEYQSSVSKLSLDGKAIWTREMVGTTVVGFDGTIYSIATPSTAGGPVSYVYATSDTGKTLWNYTDGVSSIRYLQFQGEGAKAKVCMPATVGTKGSVICLDGEGKLISEHWITDSVLIRYDLIGNDGNFYVRRSRDNSYWHNGTNVLYPLFTPTSPDWNFTFPDDVDMVGPISRSAGNSLVVMTRPDCQCRADSLITIGPDGKMLWNATLPGEGDQAVNPAYPPQFGPYSASNGMVFASTVQKLQGKTAFDMWYSAVDKSGKLVWKLPFANITDQTTLTYTVNADGDFYIIRDGILYKISAAVPTKAKAVFV